MIYSAAALLLLSAAPSAVVPQTPPARGELPTIVRDFPGFRYAGERRRVPTPFEGPIDWTEIVKAPAATGKPFRLKVVAFTRTSGIGTYGEERVLNRQTVEEPDEARLMGTLALLPSLVSWMTGGRLALKVDVQIEREPVAVGIGPAGGPLSVENQVYAFVNEARFDAEDGLDRGPYHLTIGVLPNARSFRVGSGAPYPDLTPFAPVSFRGEVDAGAMERSVLFHVREALLARYRTLTSLRDPQADRAFGDSNYDWLLDFAAPDGAALAAAGRDGTVAFPDWSPIATTRASVLGGYTAEAGSDPEKGAFLRISERGYFRGGGIALPMPESGIAPKALKIVLRSDAPYPVAIGMRKTAPSEEYVALGYDETAGFGSARTVPFRYDGSWQTVVVPVEGATELWIGPTLNMQLAERRARGPIVLDILSVEATDEVPAASPAPPSYVPKDAIAGLGSDDFRVRLNAVERLRETPDPKATAALTSAIGDLEPEIGMLAVLALEKIGTEEAVAAIRKAVKSARSDRVKAVAAPALARLRPTKETLLDIQPVFANRSWQTRIAAAEAAALIPLPESGVFRMSLIGQEDPRIKLRVTQLADPKRDFEARKLLYSVVNEPWDAVRLASAIRLLESDVPGTVTEALKAIRDDSVGVRRPFARALADRRDARFRAALRLAAIDRDPVVRIAGIDGLAALGTPTEPELRTALADEHPEVQLALIRLAKATGFVLPEATRASMRRSRNPRVVEAERELGKTS